MKRLPIPIWLLLLIALLVVSIVVVASAAAPTATVDEVTQTTCSAQPFCGDFDTGSVSPWNGPTNEGLATITVDTAANQPVKQGNYSAKFVTPPQTGTGNARAEIYATQAQTGGYPGQDWYYGWWTMFPSSGNQAGWQSNTGDWNVITQFQSVDWTAWMGIGIDQTTDYYPDPAPKIYFGWGGDPHRINGHGKELLADPLQYDHWYHFVVHAKWSTDPAAGFIEIWVDGTQVVPQTFGATLYDTTVVRTHPDETAPGAYAELDLYHGATQFTNTVIHDGFCRTATYADATNC
jgi:hypothetical protein